jgi:hypothetical protein
MSRSSPTFFTPTNTHSAFDQKLNFICRDAAVPNLNQLIDEIKDLFSKNPAALELLSEITTQLTISLIKGSGKLSAGMQLGTHITISCEQLNSFEITMLLLFELCKFTNRNLITCLEHPRQCNNADDFASRGVMLTHASILRLRQIYEAGTTHINPEHRWPHHHDAFNRLRAFAPVLEMVREQYLAWAKTPLSFLDGKTFESFFHDYYRDTCGSHASASA